MEYEYYFTGSEKIAADLIQQSIPCRWAEHSFTPDKMIAGAFTGNMETRILNTLRENGVRECVKINLARSPLEDGFTESVTL